MGSEISEELIHHLVDDFRGCIECSENHLTGITYFHKQGCLRGAGLPLEVFRTRLSERIHYLDIQPPKPLWMPISGHCVYCRRPATGTHWVQYHGKTQILYQDLVCEGHAQMDDPAGRVTGYIPGKAFERLSDVEKFLEKAYA